MRDKSPVKIICRIITLLHYIIITTSLLLESELLIDTDNNFITKLANSYLIIILICTIPLIITMIIALVIKYTCKNKSKVNIYRILDVITRTVSTIPITLIANYYIMNAIQEETLINILIGVVFFIVLNQIIKFTLQETLEVSFITSDNL